jgi:hypothetical protein
MNPTGGITDEVVCDRLSNITMKLKYSNFQTPENIKELKINFYDDERILKLTNGCLHISRRYY